MLDTTGSSFPFSVWFRSLPFIPIGTCYLAPHPTSFCLILLLFFFWPCASSTSDLRRLQPQKPRAVSFYNLQRCTEKERERERMENEVRHAASSLDIGEFHTCERKSSSATLIMHTAHGGGNWRTARRLPTGSVVPCCRPPPPLSSLKLYTPLDR